MDISSSHSHISSLAFSSSLHTSSPYSLYSLSQQ
jgi:hypothetical protein